MYLALRAELEAIRAIRSLSGEPLGVESADPREDVAKSFRLATSRESVARVCEQCVRSKVEIRTIAKSNVLHRRVNDLL